MLPLTATSLRPESDKQSTNTNTNTKYTCDTGQTYMGGTAGTTSCSTSVVSCSRSGSCWPRISPPATAPTRRRCQPRRCVGVYVYVYVYVVLCCVVWSDALPPSSTCVWWISALLHSSKVLAFANIATAEKEKVRRHAPSTVIPFVLSAGGGSLRGDGQSVPGPQRAERPALPPGSTSVLCCSRSGSSWPRSSPPATAPTRLPRR